MSKMIRVTMPDCSEWDVPAEFVAEHRARYYAAKDSGATGGEMYDRLMREEMDVVLALNDHSELVDWAMNNMNWEDVSSVAVLHSSGKPDYRDGWINGKQRVVEVEDTPATARVDGDGRWRSLRDELRADIDRPDGRRGIHGHEAVDDDYFQALEYVVSRMDEILSGDKP